MRWRKYIPPEPDPFTEDERDRLLDYFRAKRWKIPSTAGTTTRPGAEVEHRRASSDGYSKKDSQKDRQDAVSRLCTRHDG